MSLKEKMTALADAVREKAELTDSLTIDEMTEAVNGLVVNGIDVDERTLTVTPSKSQQTFMSSNLGENAYYSTVTINAIPSEYITTNDATAASSDILEGKTAYVNGQKRTGTMTNHGDVVKKFNNGSDTLIIPANGYYSTIKVTLTKKNLTITPSAQKQTFDVLVDEDIDVFYSRVTVDPIPSDYITTADATAESVDIIKGKTAYVNGQKVTGVYKSVNEEDVRSGVEFGAYSVNEGTPIVARTGSFTDDATAADRDILEGKTAYVHGKKRVGIIATVTATLEGNVVTVPKGYIAEAQTITIPEMPAVSVHLNAISMDVGYNKEVKSITIGKAVDATTYTPGVADIVIPKKSYLVDDHIIKGDGDLTAENIKVGVSIFDVEGTFTSDADAEAKDIAVGKTAYVNGEKITGTASGGAVVKYYFSTSTYNSFLSTFLFTSAGEMSVPANVGRYHYLTSDGKLFYQDAGNIKYYADSSIQWKYAVGNSADDGWCMAISADSKLYCIHSANRNSDDEMIAVRICENIEGITQVMVRAMNDKALVIANGYLYLTNYSQPGNYAQVQYERSSESDPIVYVEASNVLNCTQASNWESAYIITADGSLATVWKDGYEGTVGNAYAKIYDNDKANGNPFLNYYPVVVEYLESNSRTYELAFRSDGLYYRIPSYEPNAWTKVDDPGFIKTQMLGYCETNIGEDYSYNEETGEETITYTVQEYRVALLIDESGRLWKLAAAATTSDRGWEFTGLSVTQVGEDTDWQCVSPSVTYGSSNFAQKGGKLVMLYVNRNAEGKVELTWKERPFSPNGRMIANMNNADLFFAPEDAVVDLSKPGGTY